MQLIDTSEGTLLVGNAAEAEEMVAQNRDEPDHPVHFDLVWNLGAELDTLAELETTIADHVVWTKIPDYGVPDAGEFSAHLDVVVDVLRNDQRVFVHCYAGHGRTGMAVAAIKKRLDGLDSDQAIQFALEHCGGPETMRQREFVQGLERGYSHAKIQTDAGTRSSAQALG